MNLNKNYYGILGLDKTADKSTIKKTYYKLSMTHHPDKGGDSVIFSEISESYDILSDKNNKKEYDLKSQFGLDYDESIELLKYSSDVKWDDVKYQDFKKNELLNIIVYVDDTFSGKVEYERWVLCKTCNGSGKDLDSKIVIKDSNGNIVKMFDGDDGCDFCEGTGKDWKGNDCGFCFGAGKIGSNDCSKCNGEKRILGKQKLSGIKTPDNFNEEPIKIESMGHTSKTTPGKSGHLYIIKK